MYVDSREKCVQHTVRIPTLPWVGVASTTLLCAVVVVVVVVVQWTAKKKPVCSTKRYGYSSYYCGPLYVRERPLRAKVMHGHTGGNRETGPRERTPEKKPLHTRRGIQSLEHLHLALADGKLSPRAGCCISTFNFKLWGGVSRLVPPT